MNSSSTVIEVEALTKHYYSGFWRKKVQVLRGIDLTIQQGETFGLLGPNGAGKTTLIKSIVGLIRPSGGSVSLFGKDPQTTRIRANIGFLPETPSVYAYLTGYEFLQLCGQFFSLPSSTLRQRIPELLDRVKLSDTAAKKQIRTYSKGMMQRLGFAQALINNPQLLLLDEPMSGLDPLGRYDVEAICDRVGLLVDGRIVLESPIEQLLHPLDNLYHIVVRKLDSVGQNNIKRLSLRCVEQHKGQIEATFNSLDTALKGIAVARQSGGVLLELKTHRRGLEEIFVEQVNKAREENA
jgi:ABC-2 type transport system ATP-binding protein